MSFHDFTTKYDIVDSELRGERDAGPGRRPRRCPFTMATVLVMVIATTFGMLSFLALGLYYRNLEGTTTSLQETLLHPCGNSSVEALERGCRFDQLMWAWFPPHCPHYANEMYLRSGPERPWRFFSDPYKRIEATESDWVRTLNREISIYGERQEHLAHCVFMFVSLAEILRDNGRRVQKYTDFEHTEHCAEILLKMIKADERREEVETFAGPVAFNQNC